MATDHTAEREKLLRHETAETDGLFRESTGRGGPGEREEGKGRAKQRKAKQSSCDILLAAADDHTAQVEYITTTILFL